MRPVRVAVAAIAAAALVPLTATTALAAAPPSNDRPGGAVSLTLGQTYTEDTTDATTGSLDARLNEWCGAPYTNASVWFTFTPSDNVDFAVDMSQSDYTGGFMLFKGTPTPRDLKTCGPTILGWRGKAGTTYTIVAFSDTTTNGGNLVLTLENAPKPQISVTVDPSGQVLSHGRATVSGSYTCQDTQFGVLQGRLTQIWKRLKIQGQFGKGIHPSTCNGEPQTWQKTVNSPNGLYADGAAMVHWNSLVCGLVVCEGVSGKQKVVLSNSGTISATGGGSVTSVTTRVRGSLTWNSPR